MSSPYFFVVMRGVEGVPLKYLVIALVGSVSIALAVQFVNSFESVIVNTTSLINSEVTGQVVSSTLGDTYVIGLEKLSVLDWSFSSSGVLNLTLQNVDDSDLNITNVSASFGGVVGFDDSDFILSPGSSKFFSFSLGSAPQGSKVSIGLKVVVGSPGGGNDEVGSLVGVVK